MPIDTSKSHGSIVKELLDEYKKKGKIGTTTPRDLEHAVSIANAIAYNAKEESVLTKIQEFNAQEAIQLSIDVERNLENYIYSVIKQNEEELKQLVSDFIQDYTSLENKRLKSMGVSNSYRLNAVYSPSRLVFVELHGKKVPVGYRQNLGYLTANTADKALKRTNHFFDKLEDSTLIIEISASYYADIKLTADNLAG